MRAIEAGHCSIIVKQVSSGLQPFAHSGLTSGLFGVEPSVSRIIQFLFPKYIYDRSQTFSSLSIYIYI